MSLGKATRKRGLTPPAFVETLHAPRTTRKLPMDRKRKWFDLEPARHIVEYVAFRVVVCLVDMVPLAASIRLAETLAFVIHRLLPRKLTRYHVARDNIRQAFGRQVHRCSKSTTSSAGCGSTSSA